MAAVERFGNSVGTCPFDCISGRGSEYHGIFRLKHFDKRGHFLRIYERPDAIVNKDVGDGVGQALEGIKDRFLTGFSAGNKYHLPKSFQRRSQQFCRPFFFSGRDGEDDFGYAFDSGEFFKGIGQKRFAVDFDELLWGVSASAFAFAGGDENEGGFHTAILWRRIKFAKGERILRFSGDEPQVR